MTTTKPMTVTSAKAICARAVSLVTGALDSTDWTAPGMWENARKVEASDDRHWYRSNRGMARSPQERDALLVLTMYERRNYSIADLYGMRAPHRDAVILAVTHADKLDSLGIDLDELRAAVTFLGEARRK